ncbi:hypothetical protein [Miniimonas sp. S16]|uniref:hypothetical protein n=1 Tax=Miniimonas sp. S16 TaxID=2171623 RepID=UPI000D52A51D|nr:hypothetical protein [Miniimonas sp. S16]
MSRDRLPQWFLDSDPDRNVDRDAREDDAALVAILNSPRLTPADGAARPAATGSAQRVAVLRRGAWGVAAALVVGVVVTVATTLATPTPAFADWTPSPTPPTTDLTQRAIAACPLQIPEVRSSNDSGGEIVMHDVELVTIDVRGSHAHLIAANEYGWLDCFVGLASNGVDVIAAGNAGFNPAQPLATPAATGITVVANGTTSWAAEGSEPAGSYTSAYGRAGSQVSAVTLLTTTGDAIHATVTNGWWSAWLPATTTLQDVATLTMTSGSTSTTNLSIAAFEG